MQRLSISASLLMGLAPACGLAAALEVAVSIPPHGWIVERIGGEEIDVVVLVASGESPATYQPSDAQVTRLMRSAVYFRTGMPFEGGPWFGALVGQARPQIVDLREGIPMRGRDPHAWLSPRLLRIQARNVARTLARQRPARRSVFEARLERFEADVDRQHRWIRDRLMPYSGRTFLVFHPSWSYFAAEYGLRQLAIEIDGKEPSDSDLTRLQKQARAERVSVVFVQPQISGRGAAAIAQAIGGRIEVLDPLARDVLGNLRLVTERLSESFR